MDSPRPSRRISLSASPQSGSALRCLVFGVAMLIASSSTIAQSQSVTAAAAEAAAESADRRLEAGMEAARLGDHARAAEILSAGAATYPGDPRFAVELAGLAFLENDRFSAWRWLRRAKRRGSRDPYVDDFLGTLALLDGDVEAALSHWNPIAKPLLSGEPTGTGLETHLDAGLSADAAAFVPGAILSTGQYLRGIRAMNLLGVCGRSSLDLEAAENQGYIARFRCTPRTSFGESRLTTIAMLARGLAYQALHLRAPNIGRKAVSVASMVRWDPRKRRAWLELATPIAGKAGWRLSFFGDARHEHWQMLDSGDRNVEQAFVQKRWEAGAAVQALIGARTLWENRVSFSHRTFPLVSLPGPPSGRLGDGAAVKYGHRIERDLFRLPQQRLFAAASASASYERYLGLKRNLARASGSLVLSWFPSRRARDLKAALNLHAGALAGEPPLPELYAVGLERDGAVPLRAHIGTSGGRKGSALFGDRYFVTNLELSKTLLRAGVVTLSAGPFLDSAWVRDPRRLYGARTVQFDAGVMLVAASAGGTEVQLSYGWNIRTGRGFFYGLSEPYP